MRTNEWTLSDLTAFVTGASGKELHITHYYYCYCINVITVLHFRRDIEKTALFAGNG